MRPGAGAPSEPVCLLLLLLLPLLALPGAAPVAVEDAYIGLDFFQESFPSQRQSGEYLDEFNGEEIFHVDLERREAVWRLPDSFTTYSFEAQGALGELAALKNNLEIMMRRTNRTRTQNVPPSATVYPRKPVELGNPNTLICFVDQFFPPVLNITWLKNGEVVSQGETETEFYPSTDATFCKFSYLSFIPESGDVYVCKVDHWGLTESLSMLWYSEEPIHLPETMENVVCAIGLALGILGIIAGTILCFKARQGNEANYHQGAR